MFESASDSEDEFYDTSNPKLGVCIIFNCFKFKDKRHENRHGSLKDTQDLERVTKDLGLDVRIFHDSTLKEIKTELKKGNEGPC